MPIDTNAILQLQLMMGIRTNSVGPSNKDIEGGQTANLEMVPVESSNHNQNRSYRRSNSANAFVKTPLHQIDDSINDKELTTSENVFTTAQSNTATRKSINDSNKSLSPMSSSFSRASSEMKKDFSVGANSAVVYEFNQSIGSNDDGISTIDKHLETNAESKQINSIAADIETGLSIIRKVEDDSKSSSDFSDDDTVNEMNTTVITRSNNFKSRHYNSVPAVSISENSDAGQIESDLLAKEDNVGLPMPSNDNRTSFVKLGTPTNWSRIAPNGSFIASGPNRSVKSEKEKRMEQLRKAMEKYKSTHILKDENGSDTVKVKKSRLTKWLLLLDSPYVKLFIFWFVWITTGALVFFYSQDELNFVRSFYTSVSVGYNVFWVTLPRGSFSEKYGIVHMLVGNVAIGAAMAVSARVLVANKNNWYVDAMRAKLLEDAAKTDSFLDDVIAWCKYYWPKMKIHILFLIWLLFGIISSMLVVKPEHNWSFYDGLLFSASALTSGGLLPVPYDTADWYFGVIGLYIATGIPIMALSFGIIANTAVQNAGSEEFSQQISAPVTNEEIEMMRSFGMEDGDGAIDAMEYVILILVRIKALQPELINIINDRFNDLDKENAGKLSYEQILNNKVGAQRKSVGIVGSGTDKNDENISRSPIRRLTQSFSIKY